MKKIIRKGVFETNSSSTHSLTLKNKSRLEKLLLIYGLLNYSKIEIEEIKESFDGVFEKYFGEIQSAKTDMVKTLFLWLNKTGELKVHNHYFYKRSENEIFYKKLKSSEFFSNEELIEIKENINVKILSESECVVELSNIYYLKLLLEINYILCIIENGDFSASEKNIFKKYEKFYNDVFIRNQCDVIFPFESLSSFEDDLKLFYRVKENLFKAYSEIENKALDEVQEELVKKNFDESTYTCLNEFCQGCLDLESCDCGFEDLFCSFVKLNIDSNDTDEEIIAKLKKILLDEKLINFD